MATDRQFENVANFRTAGGTSLTNRHGQSVKEGLLYRSARLDQLTTKDRALLEHLGIKNIVDLRGKREYARTRRRQLDDLYSPCVKNGDDIRNIGRSSKDTLIGRRYILDMYTWGYYMEVFYRTGVFMKLLSFLVFPVDMIFGTKYFIRVYASSVINKLQMWEEYMLFIDHAQRQIADVLHLLVEQDSLPLLVHCAYGKDRTGIIVALVLSVLEVEEDRIIEDYHASESGLLPMRDRLYHEVVTQRGLSEQHCRADKDNMRLMLQEISNKYGSVQQYLMSIGFTIEDQNKLKSIMLDH